MRTSTFPLYDKALGGTLEATLRQWRNAGDSLEAIAFRLRTEHDVEVSTTTVHRWCASLGIDRPSASEAAS